MSKMTADEARAIFNKAIADETDPDRIAKVEMVREYFCNPEFRKAASDLVWATLRKG